jgi:hypothetical protein
LHIHHVDQDFEQARPHRDVLSREFIPWKPRAVEVLVLVLDDASHALQAGNIAQKPHGRHAAGRSKSTGR